MTIIVAGYDPDPWALSRTASSPLTQAFILSDSRLSREAGQGRQIVSDAAVKIERIPIRIGIPLFTPAGTSTNCLNPSYEGSCGIAYAGNEFLGRSVIASFLRTAASLVYTWCGSGPGVPGRYEIVKETSPLAVSRSDSVFDEGIDFDVRDLPKVTGDILSTLLQEDFQTAIDDTLRHEANNGRLGDYLRTDLVLVTANPSEDSAKIFWVRVRRDESKVPPWLTAQVNFVQPDQLVVLGQTSWTDELTTVLREARRQGRSAVDEIQTRVTSLVQSAETENFVGGQLRRGTAAPHGGFNVADC